MKIHTTKNIVLIILAVGLVYANSLKNDFAVDDFSIIVENKFVKSWHNFHRLFARSCVTPVLETRYIDIRDVGSGENSYRPLVTASYFIDYPLWKLNPLGYHIHNLLLHAGNALLIYWLALLLGTGGTTALVAAILFGLHPVNNEAVNVISFREDLQCCFFFLLSFITYIYASHGLGKKKIWLFGVSLASFFLALLSKEMAATMPLILIVYEAYFPAKDKKKFHRLLPWAGYAAVLTVYLWLRFVVMVPIAPYLPPLPGGNWYTNALTMCVVIAQYLHWFILPVNIHFVMPFDQSFICRSFFDMRMAVSLPIISLWIYATVKTFRTRRLVSFGLLWVFLTLPPVLNIVPLMNFMAARYLYLPAVGFCLFLATLLQDAPQMRYFTFSNRTWKIVRRDALMCLFIFYASFTFTRNLEWRNNIVFWSNMVAQYPDNDKPHLFLANAYRKQGLLNKAVPELLHTLRVNPVNTEAHINLGLCYLQQRKYGQAEMEFRAALALAPYSAFAYNNLGCVKMEIGRGREGIEDFLKAIELEPQYPLWYKNLGIGHLKMNQREKAEAAWRKALELAPEDAELRRNLQLLKQGKKP